MEHRRLLGRENNAALPPQAPELDNGDAPPIRSPSISIVSRVVSTILRRAMPTWPRRQPLVCAAAHIGQCHLS